MFLNAVSAQAKMFWPGLKVASELTFDGIINYNSFAQTLNTNSDYIGVSYYPLNSNFTVKPVSTIPADFASLVALYPAKKINFYQYGYPSSTVCASSDVQQKQFITQTFTSWDTYASNIHSIDFSWLHDLDTAAVNYYGTYYGITLPAFLEFLRTIGLREWANKGTDKQALDELRCQAKVRGFNILPLGCFPLGIEEDKARKDLNIYPNPTNDWFKFDALTDCTLKMYDVNGKLVLENKFYSGEKIDAKKLEKGIYFVVAEKEGEFVKTKLLME